NEQSQGHIEGRPNYLGPNIEATYAKEGHEARSRSDSPLDAASTKKKLRASSGGTGNPEMIGTVEQVGSASATAQYFDQ
ncbi:hypothetical protein FA15DRAFT_578780, partial [Coprinopsis marcescibilis]